MRRVESFRITIPRSEPVRLLGMHRGGRPPRESVLRCLDEECETAHALVEPRAVWMTGLSGLPGSRHIPPDVPVAVAVCTIGPRLEERVRELSAAGQSARAMILDAIGSAAAEVVADRSNGRICEVALRDGDRPDRRRSPGYGGWDVSEQDRIFSVLDPSDIGVMLTPGKMMRPGKSVSFLVPLTGGRPETRPPGRCTRCGYLDCEYREGR